MLRDLKSRINGLLVCGSATSRNRIYSLQRYLDLFTSASDSAAG